MATSELLRTITAACASSGLQARVIGKGSQTPFRLRVEGPDGITDYRMFLWNITSTHRGNDDEFGVQVTRQPEDLALYDEAHRSLVLGFDAVDRVFVAWSPLAHPNPGGRAPRLYVRREEMTEARAAGLRVIGRAYEGGREPVCIFTPDLIGGYLEIAGEIHGVPPADALALIDGDDDDRATEQVRRAVRARRFGREVRANYGDSCAMCPMGLGIFDAAHIIEVKNRGSDDLDNGILLCPTHHRSWDAGHLLIHPDQSVTVSRQRLIDLGFSDQDVTHLEGMTRAALRPPVGGVQPSAVHLQARLAAMEDGAA